MIMKYSQYDTAKVKSQHGFSLLEVLIAMVVVAVGFTSVLLLQMKSLQASHSSYQQSMAVVQANDLVERLWAGVCVLSDEDIRDDIIDEWEAEHTGLTLMPDWTGAVSYDTGNFMYTIVVSWSDRLDGATRSFSYHA